MARNNQRPECTEVSSIRQGNQAKGDDDQKNCFFMHVPAEKERRVSAQRHGSDEVFPSRPSKELDQGESLGQ